MKKLSRKDYAKKVLKDYVQVHGTAWAIIMALIGYGFARGLPVDDFTVALVFILSWYFLFPIVWCWLEYKAACMEEADGMPSEPESAEDEAAKWRAIAGYYWMNRRR